MDISTLQIAPTVSAAPLPRLADALRLCAPLPPSALFLGLAEDGLPVLLNLADPQPSPVLIAGDALSGKTRLLQLIARVVDDADDPNRIRYAVISEEPSEWVGFEDSPACEGILPFHHALATGYAVSLAAELAASHVRSKWLLLLIDGLSELVGDGDLRDLVSEVIACGPAAGILPLITLDTSSAHIPTAWLQPFRCRLFGHIQREDIARDLAGSTDGIFHILQPPAQFAMRTRSGWLPFWLPTLDEES